MYGWQLILVGERRKPWRVQSGLTVLNCTSSVYTIPEYSYCSLCTYYERN